MGGLANQVVEKIQESVAVKAALGRQAAAEIADRIRVKFPT
jgi:hypothetical protein